MHMVMLLALLTLAPLMAHAGETARCTTREDPAFKRWVTECSDGARAISRWDAGLRRYRTDITKVPQDDTPPRGWPRPGKAPRR
jgi:hypothetical protein